MLAGAEEEQQREGCPPKRCGKATSPYQTRSGSRIRMRNGHVVSSISRSIAVATVFQFLRSGSTGFAITDIF